MVEKREEGGEPKQSKAKYVRRFGCRSGSASKVRKSQDSNHARTCFSHREITRLQSTYDGSNGQVLRLSCSVL